MAEQRFSELENMSTGISKVEKQTQMTEKNRPRISKKCGTAIKDVTHA